MIVETGHYALVLKICSARLKSILPKKPAEEIRTDQAAVNQQYIFFPYAVDDT